MYHAKDGLYFQRLEGGSVLIRKLESTRTAEDPKPSVPIVMDVVLDADTWASAIASVCGAGENGDSFRRAENFHSFGRGDVPTAI